DPGFSSQNVMTFGLSLPPAMSNASPDTVRAAFRDVGQNLQSAPGVEAASLSWGALPLSGDDEVLFWPGGQPRPSTLNDMNWALRYVVDPGYLQAMKIRLLRGRFFGPEDNEHSPPVVVVDDAFASRYFGSSNPLGQRINIDGGASSVEVIGIVQHVKQWGLDSDDKQSLKAQAYLPFMQLPDKAVGLTPSGVDVVVRFRTDSPLASAFALIRQNLAPATSQRVIYT